MAGLYRRGRIFWARLTVAKREYRKSLRTADRAEAQKRLARWLAEVEHLRFYGEARRTWKEAVVKWSEEYLDHSHKPSTAKRYRVSLVALDLHFGARYVDEIGLKDVAAFVSARRKDAVTNATIRRDLTALSSILRCCVAWGWRLDNPAARFDRAIIKERARPARLPSDEDLLAVITQAEPMKARILLLLLQSGMREAEAGFLKHDAIDPAHGEARLMDTKSNRVRTVALTAPALATLRATPRHLKSANVFWHGARGAPFTGLSNVLRRAVIKALPVERRFTIHSARARYIVDELRAGADIYAVSRHVGHASVKTTERYVRYYAAQKSAQSDGLPPGWPYAKPLRELSYDEIVGVRAAAAFVA